MGEGSCQELPDKLACEASCINPMHQSSEITMLDEMSIGNRNSQNSMVLHPFGIGLYPVDFAEVTIRDSHRQHSNFDSMVFTTQSPIRTSFTV